MSTDLMFDPTITAIVAQALRAQGVDAVVDDYEPGMAQVRVDPTDGGPVGYIAVAGTTDEGAASWVLLPTFRGEDGFYDTAENGAVIDLGLPHDAPAAEVAAAAVRAASVR